MNELQQVFLNGSIGVVSIAAILLIVKNYIKTSKDQQIIYADMMKDFIKSVIDEMKETTKAVKELTDEIRREK